MPMQTENDLIIIHKIQAGDKNSFALLVNKYNLKIQRLILRFVKNESIAQELTQDTFIKAYRALANFRGEAAFYTWLYRIGVNVAKTWLVQHQTEEISTNYINKDNETFDIQDTLKDNHTPDDSLQNQQTIELIQKTLDKLPDDLRIALTLRELDGLSYEDIAQVMECPIGTVRSRIFRAREVLSQKLAAYSI